jgi:hypothetical protein
MGRDARSYVYRAAQMLGLDQFLAIKPLNGIDFVPNLRTSSNEPIGGRYARFTKILTAYAYHRTALQTHDPIGYNMVVDVLTAVGLFHDASSGDECQT